MKKISSWFHLSFPGVYFISTPVFIISFLLTLGFVLFFPILLDVTFIYKLIFLFLVILKKYARDLSILVEVPKKTLGFCFLFLSVHFISSLIFTSSPTSFFLIYLSRMCFSSIFFRCRLFLANSLSLPSLSSCCLSLSLWLWVTQY